jgi:hypothetical protein
MSLWRTAVVSKVWRRVKPRPAAASGSDAVLAELRGGRSLGEALQGAGPALAQVAVSEAARRFEGGAIALFIVDVRDALGRQLLDAGRRCEDAQLHQALAQAARRVDDDTFVQHLINALLEANRAYVEANPVDHIAEGRSTRALTQLLARALSSLISRHDGARRLGERTPALEFVPFPAPSAPR